MTSNERIFQPFTLPNGTELKTVCSWRHRPPAPVISMVIVTSELVSTTARAPEASVPLLSSAAFIDETTVWPSRARSASIMMKNCRLLAKTAEAIAAPRVQKAILQIHHGTYGRPAVDRGASRRGAERYCRAARAAGAATRAPSEKKWKG